MHRLKREVGREAAALVESGMRLGLGTGSTVAHFLEALAARLSRGEIEDVAGVPTSVRTERAARRLGVPLGTLAELAPLDMTVDGADEVDPELNLIKGLGGALLREKMVAQASRRFVAIADESKLVGRLGEKAPVPVEVVPFQFEWQAEWLQVLGAEPVVRLEGDGEPYRTDNGNLILDCRFVKGIERSLRRPGGWPAAAPSPMGIDVARALDRALAARAGVVESGLFLGLASEALIASANGVLRLMPGGPT